ncbi:MAG: hypothetical protein M4579_005810 [Chaenotheca gracillima]|nr:MAG: hypothetical protein M4579_005810 [Chaenotheca gracillima]
MPPSSNRRTRARRDLLAQEGSDPELPDSSPSRPSRKKRRTNANEQTQPAEPEGSTGSNGIQQAPDEEMSLHDRLVNQVTTNFDPGEHEVRAAIDHANDVLEKKYQDGVQAYAKVAGRDWTYYVKKLKVNIGRPPDPGYPSVERSTPSAPPPEDEDSVVQIDLGPSKHISRLHAIIEYFSEDDAGWQLTVNGRNGVRVNDQSVRRGGRIKLRSGDVMEIGGTQMMFVLPDETPQIHPMFLAPHMVPSGLDGNQDAQVPRSSSSQHLPSVAHHDSSGPVPLAPAPSDYKRPSTPTQSRAVDGRNRQSPPYNRGLMLETTGDLDYSLESAKDLKPPYSYAIMIGQAILASEEEKLTLNSIYQWIMDKYAFYRHSNTGWQNSIRHNLSLNKAFEKIPRRTDEPGKGMKWQIVPSHREEFTKRASRPAGKGGPRGSSGPNSPASKDGSYAMGNHYPHVGHAAAGAGTDESRDATRSEDRLKQSPRSVTPPLSSYPVAAKEAFTPDRGPRISMTHPGSNGVPHGALEDGSPLPISSRSKPNGKRPQPPPPPAYGLSDAITHGSPPTLSSSAYMDENQPMITPAPRRQLPRLAPPSTAQRPSAYMPTSSPAPFWKYLDFGSTPAKPMPDLSPSKSAGGPGVAIPQSSSPPPPTHDGKDLGSPSKPKAAGAVGKQSEEGDDATGGGEEDEEDMGGGIDLARGFQTIGSFHSSLTNATA